MVRTYIAEAIGTFALSFVVVTAVAAGTSAPLAVPVIAALTLGLFVYTVGGISGTHINPAVTLGLWSVGKIETKKAGFYILAQVLGALIALFASKAFMPVSAMGTMPFDPMTFAAEALGAAFFTFGIASVVYGKVHGYMSGMVVGGSLLLGILIASLAGAAGILNPAVALALGVESLTYFLAPIVGAVAGFWTYRYIAEEN
jgi:glycerol uptake facilitator-like aquaporin